MGVVEEVGSEVTHIAAGRPRRRPVQHLLRPLLDVRPRPVRAVRDDPGPRAGQGRGAVRLHRALRRGAGRPGRVPAGAAGPVRADQGARGPPDERFLFLSDVLPTAWQAVPTPTCPTAARSPSSGSGPIGQMATRIALHLGVDRVIGVDPVPERLAGRGRCGVEADRPRRGRRRRARRCCELTGGRGADAVIDAVGMEAHGVAGSPRWRSRPPACCPTRSRSR